MPNEDESIVVSSNSEALYHLMRLRIWAEANGCSLKPISQLRTDISVVKQKNLQQADVRNFFARQSNSNNLINDFD